MQGTNGVLRGFAWAVVAVAAMAPIGHAADPNHPIITEVYTDPPGLNDGPIGRDPSSEHQEFIEIFLPLHQPPGAPLASALAPLKDALRLTFYEIEGDTSSSGPGLVNYRFDLPPFDLDPSNGTAPGAVARPTTGVVVLGWVDYLGSSTTELAGTAASRTALIRGGITSLPAPPNDYLFIAINGHHSPSGTTNFLSLSATTESKIDLPAEASSGIVQNGSSAYLLVARDLGGYVQLCDDAHAADCAAGSDPNLIQQGLGLDTGCHQDGYAGNDDGTFDYTQQPFPSGGGVDLDMVLPLGGAFSLLVAQIPEFLALPPAPGTASGYARVFVDVAKTTETAAIDDPAADAALAYRHIRGVGPFFATPGRVVRTTSPPELAVATGAEQMFQVLAQTTGRPGVLAANVGGNYGINMATSPGASSNPSVVTFAPGTSALGVAGQAYGLPMVAITPGASAAHGSSASATVTVTATNTNGGDPAVVSPVQVTTITATVLKPTTGQNAAGQPFQTTVFAAVQAVPAQAGVNNEFRATSLGTYVAANLGGAAQDTLGHGAILIDPASDLNNGPFVQLGLVKDFPDPGAFVNYPGPGFPKLDLRQTVLQSAESVSGAATYVDTVDAVGVRAVRLNHPDTLTFGGTFTPSEPLHFVDAVGDVGQPRSGLSNAATTRTFELAIVESNVRDDSSLETGATDDFGIVVEVAQVEAGAPVVPGEFVFLSLTGGLQGADVDTLDVPPYQNVANIVFLDLDNLHTVLGIRALEAVYLIDASGTGEIDPIELFSLNPATQPTALQGAEPSTTKSLWRSAQNTMRLTFTQDITAPPAGAVLIQQMLAGALYGGDLSAGFSFALENDGQGNPRILKIVDTGPSDLTHRQWYAVRNTGGWTGVAPFTVQYVVQVGDADNDGKVLNLDAGAVNVGVPNFSAADNDRRDVDGDARILNGDVSLVNARIPSFTVQKPTGH
ncbi:MAG: hypothetical protein HY763_05155 [Planctomycetes bacterium]|nr:hypothetical protein [Planctomycetota bacterium]